MLYGIIADVHSNLEALEAVLKALKKFKKIICVGDIVGYGPNPNECIEKIKGLDAIVAAGNHDKAAAGLHSLEFFNKNTADALVWTKSMLSNKNINYLAGLPLIAQEDDFQVVHGSLRQPLDEYICAVAEAMRNFKWQRQTICFTGHTHKPLYVGLKKDGNYKGGNLYDGDEVLADDYDKLVVNVGSAGQPRDGDSRASFGIYNSKSKIITLYRTAYDFEKTQKKMKESGLPEALIRKLGSAKTSSDFLSGRGLGD